METVTEADLLEELNSYLGYEQIQPGDVTTEMVITRYNISHASARRLMHQAVKDGKGRMVNVVINGRRATVLRPVTG